MMKLILCMHVHDISFYINCTFIPYKSSGVAIATNISHRVTMRKTEIDSFICLSEDIWNFELQKSLLSTPLRFMFFVQITWIDFLKKGC